jgi:hypothetical protein
MIVMLCILADIEVSAPNALAFLIELFAIYSTDSIL